MADRFAILRPFMRALGLDWFLDDDSVSELMIRQGLVFVDRGGLLEQVHTSAPLDNLLVLIEIVASEVGDRISESKPTLDARLPDGSRVAAMIPPVSPLGVTVTIRKFGKFFGVDDLIRSGSLPVEVCREVANAIRNRCNVLVSGGTSSGKTTMLNAFVGMLPSEESLVVIEKPIEMQIPNHPNCARFEAVPAIGTRPAFTVEQILAASLRHRPDRIIIGEVRDGVAFDMLQGMNTGHPGLSTVHADDSLGALRRLASLAAPGFGGNVDIARQETAAAIHYVIHMQRWSDGTRGVSEAVKVKGYDSTTRDFAVQQFFIGA